MAPQKNPLTPITVAHGDGIGPEIMNATLEILTAAQAGLAFEEITIGEKAYLQGNSAGIFPEAWASLRRTKVFLKAPITTPQGGGFKSLNVTVRKTLGLYANVRPCSSYGPFIHTRHPKMDLVIVRENEEDLYAGIEHRQTDEVYQCLKIISRPGCERIVRYGFEYAVRNNRKKVSCFTKDNIMKMTDGLFHKVFEEIGAEYPQLEKEHWIIDIGAAKLADNPSLFDVIVLPNLYGDILSDVTAQLAGSVGIAGSANIGEHCAMFEAIHGSAPRRAGQDLANPSGLLLGAVQMLLHLGKPEKAALVHNAWLKTIEDGVHTYDVYDSATSKHKVGTKAFAQAVVANLGETPKSLKAANYPKGVPPLTTKPWVPRPAAKKELVGVDMFVHANDRNPGLLAKQIRAALEGQPVQLKMITNRGVKVWPEGFEETFCTDHWRARLAPLKGESFDAQWIWSTGQKLTAAGIDVIKTENLYTFDGERGYSLGQGQ